VGRYVLAPAIFEHLRKLGQGAGGEIQLTDGIAALMGEEAVYAHRFAGKRYDCGSKLGYLQATVEFALLHPALGKEFRKYLQQLNLSTVASKDDPAPKERVQHPPRSTGRGNGHAHNGGSAGKRAGGRRKSARPAQSA
jgi:UTP--glucose-1-phosphate uridylyltransferase